MVLDSVIEEENGLPSKEIKQPMALLGKIKHFGILIITL